MGNSSNFITRSGNAKVFQVNVRETDLGYHVKIKNIQTQKMIAEYDADKVFIADGSARGQAILIRTSGAHIFVERDIYSFVPLAPITKFVSEVGKLGNYSYAQDILGNTYLLRKAIMVAGPVAMDPYGDYYARSTFESYRFRDTHQGISWSMDWQSNPAEYYNDSQIQDGSIEIIQNGNRCELTEEEYCNLHVEFGKKQGFSAMKITTI